MHSSSIITPRIAVTTTVEAMREKAEQLAVTLGLPTVYENRIKTAYDYILLLTNEYLGIQKTSEKKFTPFYIDFLSTKMRYRMQQTSFRKELLGRAVGIKPNQHPFIVDATAGLGRDSFILATLGFEITLLERSPIVYTLLNDALARAKKEASIRPIIERMHLIHTDAMAWLLSHQLEHRPDVIYLDPMLPKRQKSASVKKEMVILRDLLGKSQDEDQLFTLALTCATHRVVVKRPLLVKNIAGFTPNFSMVGKRNRFDIYLV